MMIDDDNIKVNVKSLRGACGDKIPTVSGVSIWCLPVPNVQVGT